jgi:hypothetical protein
MSYDDRPHDERENFLKNHLGVLLKPIVGKLSGKNAPQIRSGSHLVMPTDVSH